MASANSLDTDRLYDLRALLEAEALGNGVGDEYLFQRGRVDPFQGLSRKNTVGAGGVDLLGSLLFQRVDGRAQGAGGIDDVVDDDGVLVFHVADDVHQLGHVRRRPFLVGDGQVGVQLAGEQPRPFHAAGVGRNDHQVSQFHFLEMGDKNRQGHEVVDRDVEKTLDLGGVKVDGQDPGETGRFQQVGEQARRDGDPRPVLAVLAGVGVIGDHGRDAAGGGPLEGVGHQQQLHDVEIAVLAKRLHDEHVGAAHVFVALETDLAVGKHVQHRLAEFAVQVLRLSRRPVFHWRNRKRSRIYYRLSFGFSGAGGFEPPNVGSKGRCLTIWRHPNALLIVFFGNGSGQCHAGKLFRPKRPFSLPGRCRIPPSRCLSFARNRILLATFSA